MLKLYLREKTDHQTMKFYYLLSLLSLITLSCTHQIIKSDPSIQTVTRKLQYGSTVAFTIKKFDVPEHSDSNCTPWIYQGKLWGISVLTNPPRNILLSGKLKVDGFEIDLDTSGIANPWVDANEFEDYQARLIREPLDSYKTKTSFYYILEVAMMKGGAEDILVTWMIYKNKSFREKVEDLSPESSATYAWIFQQYKASLSPVPSLKK